MVINNRIDHKTNAVAMVAVLACCGLLKKKGHHVLRTGAGQGGYVEARTPDHIT